LKSDCGSEAIADMDKNLVN